ncbi:MAG: patatin-like phospholipase family protein [Firmicutes bacterium]|nr:patatin-like phospholipase family protein [Bacillota bacterium]
MELKIDKNRTYALALEGGGAKGAYEIGCWQALAEAGIDFNAVSGTSVGALNGAMMAMGDLEKAKDIWLNIRYSQVIAVDDATMGKMFQKDITGDDWRAIAASLQEVMANKGFDVTPLRRLMEEVVDEEAVRASRRELFIITYSLTDRQELELRAKDLTGAGEIRDMLLASAYLPVFRNERLGGKRYTDGGVRDAVPLNVLVEQGYRDIIVIRMNGFGRERSVKIPKGTTVHTVAPVRDLGSVLNFNVEQSRYDMQAGYYDAQRTLYGLSGSLYYLDRQWDEARAYRFLLEQIRAVLHSYDRSASLREINETLLPRLSKRAGNPGDYHDALVGFLEAAADEAGVEPFRIYTEEELIAALREHYDYDSRKYPEFVTKAMQTKRPLLKRRGKSGDSRRE